MGANIDIENDPTFYSKEAMEWSNNDFEDEVSSMSSNASTTSPNLSDLDDLISLNCGSQPCGTSQPE